MIFSYLRTSVWKKNKVTMEMQKEKINAKLDELGLPYPHSANVFEDRGISGAKLERPGLQALLEQLKKPESSQGTLLVYRFNRLSRSTSIMLEIMDVLEDNDIELISVMEPLPSNNKVLQKSFMRLYGVVAAFERDVISENLMLTMDRKRSEGKPLSSNTPFGYRFSRDKLIAVEEELDVVRKVYRLYLSEEYGYEKIAKKLNEIGHRFKGREFSEIDIYRMLDNATYCGFLKGGSHGDEYRGDHKPVVTEEEYDKVQQIKRQRHVKKKSNRVNWLRGKVACPLCDQNLTPKTIRQGRRAYHYYYCAKPTCKERGVDADKLEYQIKQSVIKFIMKSSILDSTIDEIDQMLTEKRQRTRTNRRQHKRAKERLFKQFESNDISGEQFKEKLKKLDNVMTFSKPTQKEKLRKSALESLLSQRSKIMENKLPEEFYFDLVKGIHLNEKYQVEAIYLKSLEINIIEKDEIAL